MVAVKSSLALSTPTGAATPDGPRVGAFFDFDGTLAAGFTGALLPWTQLRRGEMKPTELLATLWAAINHSLGRLDFEQFIRRGSLTLQGRHVDELAAIGQQLYRENIAARIYPEMIDLVAAHLSRGHTVVLSSAAFHLQIEPVAQALGIRHLLCNWCETDDDGVLTGEVLKPILRGRSKAEAAITFAAANDVDLAQSYFYADGDEDIPLMMLVGHPQPTNPAPELARLAGEHGWPVLRFSSRTGNLPIAAIRTSLATLATIPLVTATAAMARFDRRRGRELFAAWWPLMLLSLTRIRLNIVGDHHLDRARGAIYLVNHRSMIDSILVGVLLGGRWSTSPSITGVPGIRHWVDEESVVAAAEGGMLAERTVGEFDLAPFLLACDSDRQIVPIVIRNAHTIAAPGSTVLHPGTVDLAVLSPIDVSGLSTAELADCAARVRREFETVLENWPTAG